MNMLSHEHGVDFLYNLSFMCWSIFVHCTVQKRTRVCQWWNDFLFYLKNLLPNKRLRLNLIHIFFVPFVLHFVVWQFVWNILRFLCGFCRTLTLRNTKWHRSHILENEICLFFTYHVFKKRLIEKLNDTCFWTLVGDTNMVSAKWYYITVQLLV